MTQRTCSADDCDEPHEAKGYCRRHYQVYLEHGKPESRWERGMSPKKTRAVLAMSDKRRLSTEVALQRILDAGFTPLEEPFVYVSARTKIDVKCNVCEKPLTRALQHITAGHACKYCAQRAVLDAAMATAEEAAAEFLLHGFTPTEQLPERVATCRRFTCTREGCDHLCRPSLNALRHAKRRTGCKLCSMREVFDAIRPTDDQIMAELDDFGFKPDGPLVYVNASTPIPCICAKCGGKANPRLTGLRSGKTGGCLACGRRAKATSAADTWASRGSIPGWIYLVESDAPLNGGIVRKFGVTCRPDKRLDGHRRAGFSKVIQLIAMPSLELAYHAESMVKAELAADGVSQAMASGSLASGGWTETFFADAAPYLTLTPFAAMALANANTAGEAESVTAPPAQLSLWAA